MDLREVLMSDQVTALLAEREGYVVRGLPGRVAQVDAELARLGVAVGHVEQAAAGTVEEAGGGSARRRSGRR